MYSWRITKYNPVNRDKTGNYLDTEEWTSFSEIGTKVSEDEYLKFEQKYLDAIGLFIKELEIKKLQIIELEKWFDEESMDEAAVFLSNLSSGDTITVLEGEELARLTLREAVWCKLAADNQLYIHFGYDYYMYIGADKTCSQAIDAIKKSGLFIENCISPYL